MTVVERKRLYAEVWQRPVGILSRDYGVSAVKVREACKALSITLPPAGYWADKRAGKAKEPTPLPEHSGSDVFRLRAEPKENLVDWVMKNTPRAIPTSTKRKQLTVPLATVNPRYVPLSVWAAQVSGDHCPHTNTLIRWVREGRIQPQPKKIGRKWFMVPHAEYVGD